MRKDSVMAGLRDLFRRWQITHSEMQRVHRQQADARARAFLGAYGLDHVGESHGQTRSHR